MSPLSLLAKFSLEKQDRTVKNLTKSVYFLMQKLLRLAIPGYLKDKSVFSFLLSERVVSALSADSRLRESARLRTVLEPRRWLRGEPFVSSQSQKPSVQPSEVRSRQS